MPKKTLNYYPSDLSSPPPGAMYGYASSPSAVSCNNGEGGNGAVIAASIVLIILLILVVIGGVFYWSGAGSGCGSKEYVDVDVVAPQHHHSHKQKKQVSFADGPRGGRELKECSKELLVQILNKKAEPCILAFVADRCGPCVAMKPALQSAATKSNIPIYTLTFLGADKPQHVIDAAGVLKVNGTPMLYKIKGDTATLYKGDRTEASIVDFSKE